MDITYAMQAKSDQLNSVDLAGDLIIRIREVRAVSSDQPVSIYFDGDNNRPWKPSKGMVRVLAKAWGSETDAWLGRSAMIYNEPSVVYAGKPVGGIRIRSLSDVPKSGIETILVESQKKRGLIKIGYLDTARPAYPSDKFEQSFPAMKSMLEEGKMTLQGVIAHCQKTGDLTPEQKAKLEHATPIEEEGE